MVARQALQEMCVNFCSVFVFMTFLVWLCEIRLMKDKEMRDLSARISEHDDTHHNATPTVDIISMISRFRPNHDSPGCLFEEMWKKLTVDDLKMLDQRTTLFSDSLVLQREAARLGLDGSELVNLERASEEFVTLESWKIGSLYTRESNFSLVETLDMVQKDDGVKENMFEMDLEDWESLEPRKILLCQNASASQPQELIYILIVIIKQQIT